MTDCLQLVKERELDWAEWRSCEPKETVETVLKRVVGEAWQESVKE